MPLALLDLGQHGLQPLLKLAPVLGAGDQGAHVQGEQMVLSFRLSGTSPLHDPLGQPLGDGGLAHAGFADEHGVVLASCGTGSG